MADDDIIIDETEDLGPGAGKNTDVDEAAGDDKILPRGCEMNANRSVTVTLDNPVTLKISGGTGQVREERFEKLTFHRLTGADINAFQAAAREHQQIVLLTRSARLRPAIMKVLYDKMDASDIARCGKVLDTFF